MIIATVKFKLPKEIQHRFLDLLRTIVEPTLAEPGCQSCHIYVDVEDESILVFEEAWETREDLEKHIRSDLYRYILAAIDMSGERPMVRFNTVCETAGMELIHAVRRSVRGN